jgi:hypothetical protein
MRRALFFIVAIFYAVTSFASIPRVSVLDGASMPRASMLDRASEYASAFAAPLTETRIRVSDVLALFERPVPSPLNRALHQAYADVSTTNASGLAGFLSVDPAMDVAKNMAEPQRWNRYSYVTNNPMKYDDPDGRERRIMVLSVVEPGRMQLDSILNRSTTFGTDSGYAVEAQHSLGVKSLLHALSTVDGTGTDIPVILSHGGAPFQAETGERGLRRHDFGPNDIGAALDGRRAQAIVLAACGSMQSAQAVANRTNTPVFGITAFAGASSYQLGRSGAVLADVYAKTGNAAFAIAVANRMLTRKACTPGGTCDPRPQWHLVEPEKKK